MSISSAELPLKENLIEHQNNFTGRRLYSLDALRGFDMFWIMGAEEIFHTMAKATNAPFWNVLSNQFTHPDWNGFHFYDLIFPLFLFIAGVATPYSVGRALQKGKTKNAVLWRVIKRGLILVLLGIVYNNGLEIRPLSANPVWKCIGQNWLGVYVCKYYLHLFKTYGPGYMVLCFTYWLLAVIKIHIGAGFCSGRPYYAGKFCFLY